MIDLLPNTKEGVSDNIAIIERTIGLALNEKIKEHNNRGSAERFKEALGMMENLPLDGNVRKEMQNLLKGVSCFATAFFS